MFEIITNPGPLRGPDIEVSALFLTGWIVAPIVFVAAALVLGFIPVKRGRKLNADVVISAILNGAITGVIAFSIIGFVNIYSAMIVTDRAEEEWTSEIGAWLNADYDVNFTGHELERLTSGDDVDGRRDGEPVIYRLVQDEKTITFVTVDHTVVPVK